MKNCIATLSFILCVTTSLTQNQTYSFNNQSEYDQWTPISTMLPLSFSFNSPGQSVKYSVAADDWDYLLSTQLIKTELPFQIQGNFRITFKVRKLLQNSYNSYFPLLLSNNDFSGSNLHPWRIGPTSPSSLGGQQANPLLGIIFTHNQLGVTYRQINSYTPVIDYINNFQIPPNTDIWIEIINSCSEGIEVNVYNEASMTSDPIASKLVNIPSISSPLNTLFIANCNGNGQWTEHNDLLDDYLLEILFDNQLLFDYDMTPSTCKDPGLLTISNISGGQPPYQISFNGVSSTNPEYAFTTEESVSVLVTDGQGCALSSNISLNSIGGADNVVFPNVLTPNQDNINDLWFVEAECVKSFECTILNRWGNVIATLTDINQSWNGNSKDKKCSEGVYFYFAKIEFMSGDAFEYNGFFSLVR